LLKYQSVQQVNNPSHLYINDEKIRNFETTIHLMMEPNLANHTLKDYVKLKMGNYDLVFPIKTIVKIIRTEELITDYLNDENILEFLSAVLEYIALEILALDVNAANDNNKKIITPEFLYTAIDKDNELKILL